MQAMESMKFFNSPGFMVARRAYAELNWDEQKNALHKSMRDISRVLSVFNDETNRLLLDCTPNFVDGLDSIDFSGQEVLENARPFVRKSNFVIACRPDKKYQWRLYYINRVSGSVLDPSTYLKLAMDSPNNLPIPIMCTSSFQLMAESFKPVDLPLYELDLIQLERVSNDFSRALQFALRHRLKRHLMHCML